MGANTIQVEFVVNSLKTLPTNWHVVAIAHTWHYPKWTAENGDYIDGYYPGASPFLQIFYDYNNRQSGEQKGVSYNFTGCTGHVEFCIGGHAHKDYMDYYNDKLLVVTTDTDSATRSRNGIPTIEGTTSESVVNAVIADYNNNKVSVIRVGRGNNLTATINTPLG